MNSTNPPSDPCGAHDALFDQIECELAALTFAPITFAPSKFSPPDASPPPPAQHHCVDEFADTFLNWSMPPARHGRPRHSAR